MGNKPRYEKVDDHTIQIITENAKDLDLAGLIKGREELANKIEEITKMLKNVDDIIAKAKELGIVPKPICSVCKGIGKVGCDGIEGTNRKQLMQPDKPCPECNKEK